MSKHVRIYTFSLLRQGQPIGSYKRTFYPYNPVHSRRLIKELALGKKITHGQGALVIRQVDWDRMEITVE